MNFYSLLLSIKHWFREWGVALFSALSTYGLLLLAQPPNDAPEAAFVFLLPCLIWFSFRPKLSKVLWTFFWAGILYHMLLIGWMRHVTLEGMVVTAVMLSTYNLPWFWLSRKAIDFALNQKFGKRLIYLAVLPSAWVSLEWARCQFTLGFPWCPLSVTQWERPVMIQVASYTGSWGISFFLIFFNLCVGSYLHHLIIRRKGLNTGKFSSFCPDFYLGILLFILMIAPFVLSRKKMSNDIKDEVVRVGICQPYLTDKWKKGNASLHKDTLRRQTRLIAKMNPDLILWPEASTPYALNLDTLWVEDLVDEINIPLLLGAVIREDLHSYNTVARVVPQKGFDPIWYAKRTLVPFGEYVPLPFRWIPQFRKMVGPVGNFASGERFLPVSIPLNFRKDLIFGPLICYEDIFPNLARDAVLGGSDLLFVTTNDAWFGEEGCAIQHAAHSVLRAVESGLNVVRCGNAGWSGWIDPWGRIHEVLRDENENIYFKGAGIVEGRLKQKQKTWYSIYGDYFALLCLFVAVVFALFQIPFKLDRKVKN